MSFDIYATPRGAVRAMFLRSAYATPDEIRLDLSNFEKSTKTLRVNLQGPSKTNLWTLIFTDLEREIEAGTGKFEEYYFNISTWFDGRLWEIYSIHGREIFNKTVDRLVNFSSKLEHAFIPPKFMHELMENYGHSQEMTRFSAKRDYFTLTVTNPGFVPISDFADLRYASANVPKDYEILVVKGRPVGPLMLNSVDLRIRSADKECKVRITVDGFLSQVGRGDREIYFDVRQNLLQFFEKQEKWANYFPKIQLEEVKDVEKDVIIRSKKVIQPSRLFTITLSAALDVSQVIKLRGLFASNLKTSQFVGTVEKERPNESFMIRTTDLRGGGDVIITAEVGKSDVLIHPIVTTTIRTLERVYQVILEKFDVDAMFVGPSSTP